MGGEEMIHSFANFFFNHFVHFNNPCQRKKIQILIIDKLQNAKNGRIAQLWVKQESLSVFEFWKY